MDDQTKALPRAGRLTGGEFIPGGRSLPVRIEAICGRCGRTVEYWRNAGQNKDGRVKCLGPDRVECGRLAHLAELERQHSGPRTPESEAARRASRRAQKQRAKDRKREAASEELRLSEAAEAARLARCPRPDKQAWSTLEAADAVVQLMRDNDAPRAKDLHGYLCDCGAFHVGDRTRRASDPVVGRWGSAENSQAALEGGGS